MAGESLALDGGQPVRSRILPYGRQLIDECDIEAVNGVLGSEWLTTGPMVREFEAEFAGLVGATHAVAVSNGTAALDAAAWAAGAQGGDEVIVPALTFAASANCVRYLGASVVFADIREDMLCLDPAHVAALITPRTRAIVTVEFAGQPSDLHELLNLAAICNLIVIEDAAHAIESAHLEKES